MIYDIHTQISTIHKHKRYTRAWDIHKNNRYKKYVMDTQTHVQNRKTPRDTHSLFNIKHFLLGYSLRILTTEQIHPLLPPRKGCGEFSKFKKSIWITYIFIKNQIAVLHFSIWFSYEAFDVTMSIKEFTERMFGDVESLGISQGIWTSVFTFQ